MRHIFTHAFLLSLSLFSFQNENSLKNAMFSFSFFSGLRNNLHYYLRECESTILKQESPEKPKLDLF